MAPGDESPPPGERAPDGAGAGPRSKQERAVFGGIPVEEVAPALVEAEELVAELVAEDAADPAHHQHHSRFLARLAEKRHRHLERGYLYRVAFAFGGFTVLAAGVAMLVLPGPGLLVSAIGLAMLALEFAWAERLLVRVVHRLEQAKDQTRRLLRRRRRTQA